MDSWKYVFTNTNTDTEIEFRNGSECYLDSSLTLISSQRCKHEKKKIIISVSGKASSMKSLHQRL